MEYMWFSSFSRLLVLFFMASCSTLVYGGDIHGSGTTITMRRLLQTKGKSQVISKKKRESLHLGIEDQLLSTTSRMVVRSLNFILTRNAKGCPVNMEALNYTILTSTCKPPNYPPEPCCKGFLELACPNADQINNLNTNCSVIFYGLVDSNGNYPPGLFSNECKGDSNGIPCPSNSSPSTDPTSVGDGSVAPSVSGLPLVNLIYGLMLMSVLF